MDWQEAISQSKKGTAMRVKSEGRMQFTYVRYDDGSCFKLVSIDGKMMLRLSGEIPREKIEGYNDWQPS
jgi:hypothetical protein